MVNVAIPLRQQQDPDVTGAAGMLPPLTQPMPLRRESPRPTATAPPTPRPGHDYPPRTVSFPPGILARGPWQAGQVEARWREDAFEPPPEREQAADAAIAALADRGSPSHDGLAARLAGFDAAGGGLCMELQPMRWSLRLVREDASAALAALCVVRDA